MKNNSFTVVYYDEKILEEKEDASLQDAFVTLDRPGVTWMIFNGTVDPTMLKKLEEHFGLHPILLEDIAGIGERAKLENYVDNLFFVMRALHFDEKTQKVIDRQVSMILGDNYVLTFIPEGSNVLSPVFERLYRGNHRIRLYGADYLAYAILDGIVDGYFETLGKVDEKLIHLEEEVIKRAGHVTLEKIQLEKKEMSLLRRSVWPMRELINHLRRLESPLISDNIMVFLQDVNDHTNQAIDMIEGFRDVVGGMYDVYQSMATQKLNEIIKFLTIVATLFAPLTFITGVYGMNFDFMPGLTSPHGFHITVLLMILSAFGMLAFFRYRRWI